LGQTMEQQTIHDPIASRSNGQDRTLIALLVMCTMAVYCRVSHFQFIADDDPLYVSSNLYVLQGFTLHSLRWALTATPNGNWHPLTLWVWMLISTLFGHGPAAFHVVNMLLHALNVVLLYLFLQRSTGRHWPAFFTAFLWGLHPMRVESIAWISELKDVQYAAFWLGTLLVYLDYSRHRTWGRWCLLALVYTLALLSKPMAVTLPEALLLLDFWPLGQTGKPRPAPTAQWWSFRILEKIPLVVLCIIDILLQRNSLSFDSKSLPFSLRIENALVSYSLYLRDMFAPYHLGVFYPHPGMVTHTGPAIPLPEVVAAVGALLLISTLVCLRLRQQPYLAVGWFWFLGTLVPVAGLTQWGEQARADRFTYIPSIGILVALTWFVCDMIPQQIVFRRAAVAGGALIAVAFAVVSWFDLGYWQSTDTLFEHLRQIQPNNYLALSMASERLRSTDSPQSLALGKQAVDIAPYTPAVHLSYGLALQAAGRLEDAAAELQRCVDLDPEQTTAWDVRGLVREEQANQCAKTGDPREKDFRLRAITDFTNAVKANPANISAMDRLAYQLASLGKLDESIAIWRHAVQMAPGEAQIQGDLADALRVKQDLPEAAAHYHAAIADGSKNPGWETQLAYLVATNPLAAPSDIQPLIAIAKDACDQSHNGSAAALDAYAACLARVGRFNDASAAAQQAITLATAAHEPLVALGIQKRMALYQRGIPYVVGEPTTEPTTQPVGPAQ
jgi:Flp pilus assembly protein TadD